MSFMSLPFPSQDLFGEESSLPGFAYQEELFSASAEADFIRRFGELDLKAFQFHGWEGKRRIASFGFRYDYSREVLLDSAPIPEWFQPLRMVASQLAGIPPAAFRQVLVTEYAPGAGIGWHRDKPMFETVVGLSFVAPCVLRLRKKIGTKWSRANVRIAPRSGYVLRGEAREQWQHSIAPMDQLRYSVTFRTLREPG